MGSYPMRCRCGAGISDERAKLGYASCLQCGAEQAQAETQEKSNRVALAYNKGAYMYMGPVEAAKSNLQGGMNSQGRSTATIGVDSTPTVVAKPPVKQKVVHKRKAIGIMWIEGQPYQIFDRNDARIAKASRHCFFP